MSFYRLDHWLRTPPGCAGVSPDSNAGRMPAHPGRRISLSAENLIKLHLFEKPNRLLKIFLPPNNVTTREILNRLGKDKSRVCCLLIFAAVITAFSGITPVLAQPGPTSGLEIGLSVADFTWREYKETGGRLLEETGLLYGLTADLTRLQGRFGWRGGLDVFFGEMGYDGQTWSQSPVKTDVLYAGAGGYADGVACFRPLSGLAITPFCGLGGKGWLRDLDDSRTAAGVPVQGAREWWGCLFGRLGAGGTLAVGREGEVFVSCGVKLPIYARNEADFQSSGARRVGLEPDMDVSGFGDAGFRWRRLGVKVSWDTFRFDPSKSVDAGPYNLYQPESRFEVYQATLFWSLGKS